MSGAQDYITHPFNQNKNLPQHTPSDQHLLYPLSPEAPEGFWSSWADLTWGGAALLSYVTFALLLRKTP